MTRLTVIQAARAGYASRATIYRKLRDGLLNIEHAEDGTTVIDPAELLRVFGEPRPPGDTSRETPFDTRETERLRTENTLLRAENEDLRRHRDRLMTLLEQAALPAPAPRPGRTLRSLLDRAAPARKPR